MSNLLPLSVMLMQLKSLQYSIVSIYYYVVHNECIYEISLSAISATCDHLLELSANIVISGYTIPALVGSNITLSCLVEDVPTAPNTSITITCMDNGQWAPDPRQLIDGCGGGKKRRLLSTCLHQSINTVY